MADVFISYSRLDHERVKPIADRVVSLGYSIWWDRRLRPGQVFVDEIERELDGARAVLTAWSSNARNSTWVYAESSRGLDAGKPVPQRLIGLPNFAVASDLEILRRIEDVIDVVGIGMNDQQIIGRLLGWRDSQREGKPAEPVQLCLNQLPGRPV